jgi:hypothetical protein
MKADSEIEKEVIKRKYITHIRHRGEDKKDSLSEV